MIENGYFEIWKIVLQKKRLMETFAFEELELWKKARIFKKEIRRLIEGFPRQKNTGYLTN